MVPRFIFAEQHQMEPLDEGHRRIVVKTGTGSNVYFTSDHRIDTRLAHNTVELFDAAHVSVVGNGNGGHFILGRQLDKS